MAAENPVWAHSCIHDTLLNSDSISHATCLPLGLQVQSWHITICFANGTFLLFGQGGHHYYFAFAEQHSLAEIYGVSADIFMNLSLAIFAYIGTLPQ
jgi:hypothetical protein